MALITCLSYPFGALLNYHLCALVVDGGSLVQEFSLELIFCFVELDYLSDRQYLFELFVVLRPEFILHPLELDVLIAESL